MTEKEMKKLNRKQLLELLLRQTERADELQAKLDEANERLQERELTQAEAGSIAQAALELNGVFDAAEAAALQYLENIRRLSERQTFMSSQAENIARKRAEEIFAEVERRCAAREAEAEKKLKEISDRMQQLGGQRYVPENLSADDTDDRK